MPKDPDINLDDVRSTVEKKIIEFGGKVGKFEKVPVGFGLSSLNVIFVYDEKLGGTDDLEEIMKKIPGIQSCEVIDCRRALG